MVKRNGIPVWSGNSNYDLQFLEIKCGNKTLLTSTTNTNMDHFFKDCLNLQANESSTLSDNSSTSFSVSSLLDTIAFNSSNLPNSSFWTSVKPWGTDKDSGVTVTYGQFKDLYLAFQLKGSGTGNATISVLGEVV